MNIQKRSPHPFPSYMLTNIHTDRETNSFIDREGNCLQVFETVYIDVTRTDQWVVRSEDLVKREGPGSCHGGPLSLCTARHLGTRLVKHHLAVELVDRQTGVNARLHARHTSQ